MSRTHQTGEPDDLTSVSGKTEVFDEIAVEIRYLQHAFTRRLLHRVWIKGGERAAEDE